MMTSDTPWIVEATPIINSVPPTQLYTKMTEKLQLQLGTHVVHKSLCQSHVAHSRFRFLYVSFNTGYPASISDLLNAYE